MPENETLKRARRDKRQGKAASTQAGEFIREEFHHIREGMHGARSPQQAIAIGLSKARRSGVPLRPPRRGRAEGGSYTHPRAAKPERPEGRPHPGTVPLIRTAIRSPGEPEAGRRTRRKAVSRPASEE